MFDVTLKLDGKLIQISREDPGADIAITFDESETAYFSAENARLIGRTIIAAVKDHD